MTTALAKQLAARMRAKNMSVTALERKAGINAHAALNILRGQSKRPSAEVLQAIATVLGCTIPDLLGHQDIFEIDEASKSKNELLNSSYEKPELFQEAVEAVNTKIKKDNVHLTIQQAVTCVEEIYFHSLQKNLGKIDLVFTDWFIDLLRE